MATLGREAELDLLISHILIEVRTWWTCNECHKEGDGEVYRDQYEAAEDLHKQGWRAVDKGNIYYLLCPECMEIHKRGKTT